MMMMMMMMIVGVLVVVVLMGTTGVLSQCNQWPLLPNARVKSGFCANRWATGGFSRPRAIAVDSTGQVLVAERGQIRAVWDDDGNGVNDPSDRLVLVTAPNLNHEVMLHGDYLYASSDTTVYRWNYTHGQRVPITQPATTVVRNIPAAGNHPTRTLAEKDGLLYVHVGSEGNVDTDSERARVVRFSSQNIPSGGHMWNDGEVFADGLRNEVGIDFDAYGLLWGVQNGRDNLNQEPWGNINENNPCEEINSYFEADAGAFYGYPYCWSDSGRDPVTGGFPTQQWADNQYFSSPYTNEWCRTRANNIPPRWCMPAHNAPLGFTFYYNSGQKYSFPPEMYGDMFVTLHGSWNRVVPSGYQLRHILFNSTNGPVADEPFVEYEGANPPAFGIGWIRPVDAAVLPDGTLLFTSDATTEIIAVRYMGNLKTTINN